MPREVTLFTDDGLWAAVVTAWEVHLVLYHDVGARVRVYRLGVPGTWGTDAGPWASRGPWARGPWTARGPWGGAWGPFRSDGPWARGPWARGPWARPHIDAGPWGAELTRSWVETIAPSITITARYLGPQGETVREVTASRISFLRVSESGLGASLQMPDAKGAPVRIDSIRCSVQVVVDGTTLIGEVSTRSDARERA